MIPLAVFLLWWMLSDLFKLVGNFIIRHTRRIEKILEEETIKDEEEDDADE